MVQETEITTLLSTEEVLALAVSPLLDIDLRTTLRESKEAMNSLVIFLQSVLLLFTQFT